MAEDEQLCCDLMKGEVACMNGKKTLMMTLSMTGFFFFLVDFFGFAHEMDVAIWGTNGAARRIILAESAPSQHDALALQQLLYHKYI